MKYVSIWPLDFDVGGQDINQDSTFRKLQVTGGSTVIVSLPKSWVEQHNLTKGDVVNLHEMQSGDLKISPISQNSLKSMVSIDSTMVGSEIMDLLIGTYLTGCDSIRIHSKDPISRTVKKTVREFLRDSRGMEIETESEKEIIIVSLLNPSELKLQVSVNRMYILIASLVKDSFDVLSGEDVELLSDIEERERQIDARRMLIERQVASSIYSSSVEKQLGVSRYSAMEHANIARILERMGDHATRLATLVRYNASIVKMKTSEYPLKAIESWSRDLKKLIHNMYTKDTTIIHQCKINLSTLRKEVETAEDEHYNGRGSAERLFAEFKISESIRRLCAYSVNYAEALINILMYEQMQYQ